jgi:nucleotide-binding universal stress UspA family protein
MKKIIVATDFSAAATNAAEYATDMALALKAGIVLLYVYLPPANFSEVPVPENSEMAIKEAQEALDLLKDKLTARTQADVLVETAIREGAFFTELKNVCDSIKPYTVVMGSQGTTAAERLFLGGHADYATRHLEWPVITVPEGVAFSSIKKIGLACDFDKVIDATPVDEIKLLVNDFKAELHIINTGKRKVFNPETVFGSGMLQEMLHELKPGYHIITSENTDDGIMDFAEKNTIDLLIVLPKRHGFLDRLFHRSHTKQLVLHSHVPVMALHPHQ